MWIPHQSHNCVLLKLYLYYCELLMCKIHRIAFISVSNRHLLLLSESEQCENTSSISQLCST